MLLALRMRFYHAMNARFATPSEYFAAVAASGVEFSVFEGDFMPYADGPGDFWTVGRLWTNMFVPPRWTVCA